MAPRDLYLEMFRGGSVEEKRSTTAPPVREMTVGARVTMQIDIMFAAGALFLIGVIKGCSCAARSVQGQLETLEGLLKSREGRLPQRASS